MSNSENNMPKGTDVGTNNEVIISATNTAPEIVRTKIVGIILFDF
jgi:hypothetical protein